MEFVTLIASAPVRVLSVEQFVIFRHGWTNDDFINIPFDVLGMPFMVEGSNMVFQLVQEDVYDYPNLLLYGDRPGLYTSASRIEPGDAMEAVAKLLFIKLPEFHRGMSMAKIYNEDKVRADCLTVTRLSRYDFL